MTPTRMAREIANNAHQSSCFPIELQEKYKPNPQSTVEIYDDILKPEIRKAIKYGALKMHEWDKQQLKEALNKLLNIDEIKSLPADISKIVSENFWNLV